MTIVQQQTIFWFDCSTVRLSHVHCCDTKAFVTSVGLHEAMHALLSDSLTAKIKQIYCCSSCVQVLSTGSLISIVHLTQKLDRVFGTLAARSGERVADEIVCCTCATADLCPEYTAAESYQIKLTVYWRHRPQGSTHRTKLRLRRTYRYRKVTLSTLSD